MKSRLYGFVLAGLYPALMVLSGCSLTPGIAVSNTTLAFDRNERPMFLDVWNTNSSQSQMTITATPSDDWILVSPGEVASKAPLPGNVFDKATIQVMIDRSKLSAGTHAGKVLFSAPGIRTVAVKISVIQDTPGAGGLTLQEVQTLYSAPYLVEFSFTVRDKTGKVVSAEPGQFGLLAWEDGQSVDPFANGLHMQRMASRQLSIEMVLDYSAAMQSVVGAIPAMEAAASNVFLPALNADALVSVSEFHRDDRNSELVALPSINRDYTRARIAAIQSEYVRNFQSGSRMLDAVNAAVLQFGAADPLKEDRYVVLFADGRDTSSQINLDAVINAALAAQVTVYAVGFGPNAATSPMAQLASQTGGQLFTANSTDGLASAFQQIVDEMQGRYVVRWATLRRDSRQFFPSFGVSMNGAAGEYTADTPCNASTIAGDVLKGQLRLVVSDSQDRTTVFLRADYVPRNVSRFRIWVDTAAPFTASVVEAADDGLSAGWTLTYPESIGGGWVDFSSPSNTPIPFASFGSLIRLDFNGVYDMPITGIYVDNSVNANGQSFEVKDVPAAVPPAV